MKAVAKWITILWSGFCLLGILSGLANVGKELDRPMSEYEKAGAGLGIGCGMGLWVAVWVAIAGPALVVWVVSGKKETAHEAGQLQKQVTLCKHCGKYHEGETEFCPHCGKSAKFG